MVILIDILTFFVAFSRLNILGGNKSVINLIINKKWQCMHRFLSGWNNKLDNTLLNLYVTIKNEYYQFKGFLIIVLMTYNYKLVEECFSTFNIILDNKKR